MNYYFFIYDDFMKNETIIDLPCLSLLSNIQICIKIGRGKGLQ